MLYENFPNFYNFLNNIPLSLTVSSSLMDIVHFMQPRVALSLIVTTQAAQTYGIHPNAIIKHDLFKVKLYKETRTLSEVQNMYVT